MLILSRFRKVQELIRWRVRRLVSRCSCWLVDLTAHYPRVFFFLACDSRYASSSYLGLNQVPARLRYRSRPVVTIAIINLGRGGRSVVIYPSTTLSTLRTFLPSFLPSTPTTVICGPPRDLPALFYRIQRAQLCCQNKKSNSWNVKGKKRAWTVDTQYVVATTTCYKNQRAGGRHPELTLTWNTLSPHPFLFIYLFYYFYVTWCCCYLLHLSLTYGLGGFLIYCLWIWMWEEGGGLSTSSPQW